MPGFLFVKGFKGDMQMSDFSFLIEHPGKGRILFDMGLRKVRTYSMYERLDAEYDFYRIC